MKSTTFKHTLSILTLGVLGLAAGGAQADWGRGFDRGGPDFQHGRVAEQQINARQAEQMERIQTGYRNGALTKIEFSELMREQNAIREMERRFLFDGRIDPREYARLDQALDVANHNIFDEKHDRQAQYRGPYNRYN